MERLLSMMRITNEFPTRSVVRRTEKTVLKTISVHIVSVSVSQPAEGHVTITTNCSNSYKESGSLSLCQTTSSSNFRPLD